MCKVFSLFHVMSLEISLALPTNNNLFFSSENINNCKDVLDDGNTASGVYAIYLVKSKKFLRVWCDQETQGGGWLVCWYYCIYM